MLFRSIVGIGEERGIAFMMVLCGISLFIFSITMKKNKVIKKVEEDYLFQMKESRKKRGTLC